jgi:integrase/recombinase XerD
MRSYARFNLRLIRRYEQWMVAQQYSAATKSMYRQTLRLFVEFLKHKSLTDVSHLDVRRFMLHLSENRVSLDSARRHLHGLRRFYDFLNLGGLVNYVAPRLVKLRRTPRKSVPHLSEEEVRRLIRAAETPRDKALVEFFYATGCRLGEVCQLQMKDVNLNERTARVTGKYGKSRIVLLTESAADALRMYVRGRDSGYAFQTEYPLQTGFVFRHNGAWLGRWSDYGKPGGGVRKTRYLGALSMVSREEAQAELAEMLRHACLARPKKNTPLSTVTVGWLIRRLGRKAGLPRAHAHLLRHAFAMHLHENGADLTAIKILLGHVRIETTAAYAELSAFRLADVFERCHPLGRYHVKGSPRHAEDPPESQASEKAETPPER